MHRTILIDVGTYYNYHGFCATKQTLILKKKILNEAWYYFYDSSIIYIKGKNPKIILRKIDYFFRLLSQFLRLRISLEYIVIIDFT